MPVSHGTRLVVGIIASTMWSGAMGLLGLVLMLSGPSAWPERVLGPFFLLAGTMLLAGAHYVFMVLVADRLFPRAHPRLTLTFEAVCIGAFLVGLVGSGWLLVSGV